jgi:hypothetical protein
LLWAWRPKSGGSFFVPVTYSEGGPSFRPTSQAQISDPEFGQKRRRIERLQKCVTSLEAFDPQKARKRAPAIVELEAAIDKALSSAFGYGTTAYLRYNQAATLDLDPLVTKATLRSPVLRPVGGPQRGDAKAHEVSRNFSENKERSIILLRKAISTLKRKLVMQDRS